MRKLFFYLFFGIATCAAGQDADTVSTKIRWESSADLYTYFLKDETFLLPAFKTDKGKLHLEGRYNYEDRQTVSLWGGYNFNGGNALEFTITPMAGFVAGELNGVAPGLEMTLTAGKFELYTESEYFLSFENGEDNYFYNWTDLSFSFTDNFWIGISGQRTRLVNTDVDIQRGFLIGGSYRDWQLTGYALNPATDDAVFIVGLSYSF